MGFVIRWVCALLLVAATWNPTPYSYVGWIVSDAPKAPSLLALGALILLVGYIIYLRATLRSIGSFGMVLILALVGALLWVLTDFGVIDPTDPALTGWLGIVAISLVLGVGLSWSIIRRRLSGQADVDDIDE